MKLQIGKFKMDLVLLLVGVTPIFWFGPQPDFSTLQISFMHYLAAVMLASVLCNRWLGMFLLLAFAHKFLFPTPLAAWLDYALPLSIGCLIYHLVYTYYRGKTYPYVILAVIIFNICIAGLQILHIPWLSQQMLQPDGMMGLPSFFGMLLAITAPVIMTIHPALILVTLCGVLITKSIFCVLATAVGVLFYLYGVYPRIRRFLCILVIVPILLLPIVKGKYDPNNLGKRLHIWPMVASKAFHSMWTGIGVGADSRVLFLEFCKTKAYYFSVNVKPENIEPLKAKILDIAHREGVDTTRLEAVHFKQPDPFPIIGDIQDELRGQGLNGYIWGHSHNEYLQIFLIFGLPGIFILVGYIWDIVGRYRKEILKDRETIALMGSMYATMIISLAHFPFYLAKIVCVIIVFQAILDRKLSK